MAWIDRLSDEERKELDEAAFILRHADSPLGTLTALGRLYASRAALESMAVYEARIQKATWRQIGECLGRSRQSVHRQYAHLFALTEGVEDVKAEVGTSED